MTAGAAETDVIVAGTGPTGLVSALLMAQNGFRPILVGPPVRSDDVRTTALMLPALECLESIGVERSFGGAAAPLQTMQILDATRRLIRSPSVSFRASEIGETAFGMNIPNAILNDALKTAVKTVGIIHEVSLIAKWKHEPERIEARLENGKILGARLVVAADGRKSSARASAGVTISEQSFGQSAFVTVISHERDHGNISTEFHTEWGPCTLVPLPDNRSSVVWVVRPDEAEVLAELDDRSLSIRIEERTQSILGKISVEGPRQIYPLGSGIPSAFAAKRIALVGEAAHILPPIGAQGLNLGIRDAVELARIALLYRNDPGCDEALAQYDRARRTDILARAGAVAILNQSLLSDMLPAQVLRSAGLGLLSRISLLRGFFMREGMRPGSGFSKIASVLREKVGR